jgi:membrane protease YdiL (CAAX protease family)
MLVPLLGSLIYFVAYAGEPWAQATYILVKIYTVAWPLIATTMILRERLPLPRLRAPHHRRAILPGLLIGGVLAAGGLLLMEGPLGETVMANAEQIRHKVFQLGVLDHYLAFALVLSFVHSAMEEFYWRWFVFGTLRRLLSTHPAAILAALAFASHHVVILGQYFPLPIALLFGLAVAFGGYMWCLMYQRQRTLVGAWILHVILDLVIFWVGYRMLFQSEQL